MLSIGAPPVVASSFFRGRGIIRCPFYRSWHSVPYVSFCYGLCTALQSFSSWRPLLVPTAAVALVGLCVGLALQVTIQALTGDEHASPCPRRRAFARRYELGE